jgi:thiol-disulfide isomerase/thioredoxin
MGKSNKVAFKWVAGIIGILLVFGLGFLVGGGYSSNFLLNYFRDIQAGGILGQVGYLTLLREGQPQEVLEAMDSRLIHSLYGTTRSAPKGLPEDVSQWPEPVLRSWQRAKEYYERHPAPLEGESQSCQVVRQLLEKIPDSDRRVMEKEFALKYTGKTPPAWDISEWLGQPTSLEQLEGTVVLLDFWGTWCGPCLRKIPAMQQVHDRYESEGLEVIGIHSLRDSEEASQFMSENNYTFRVGLDTGQTADDYSITSWPTYYLIDRQGRLVWGPEHSLPSEEHIESLLED